MAKAAALFKALWACSVLGKSETNQKKSKTDKQKKKEKSENLFEELF